MTADTDFYSDLAKFANEVAAQIEAETKGMSDIQRAEYFLRGSREHLAELHNLKASRVLIEQAELRIARLAKELAGLTKGVPA